MGATDATAVPRPPPLTTRWSRLRPLAPAVPFVIALLLWAGVIELFDVRPITLPSIGRVIDTTIGLAADGSLWTHAAASLERLLYGLTVGVITGVVLGILGGLSRRVSAFFQPLVMFFSGLSGIVWIPLAIAWFGLGHGMVIFIIWNSVFFLVFGNTMLGVQLVPRVLEDGVRTLGARRWHTIAHVILPGALPNIMSGVRTGLGFGFQTLVAAEMVGASAGLGWMIFSGSLYQRPDHIIAGCIIIGLFGFALDRLVLARLEQRTIERWGVVR